MKEILAIFPSNFSENFPRDFIKYKRKFQFNFQHFSAVLFSGEATTPREERHSRPRETAMRFEIDNSAALLPDIALEKQIFARIRTYAKQPQFVA